MDIIEKIDIATKKAMLKSDSGFYEEAIKILENILNEDLPLLLESGVLLKLAHMSEENGKFSFAIKYCKQIIDIYKKNKDLFESEVPNNFEFIGLVFILKANSHEKLKEYQEAVFDYSHIIDIYEQLEKPIISNNLIFAYHGLGLIQVIYSQAKSLSIEEKINTLLLAINNFNRLLEIAPDYFPVYSQLGIAYSLLDNNKKSEEMYGKGIELTIATNDKEIPKDGIIYQYRKIDNNLFSNLLNYKIFLNDPKNFNDPFDCPVFNGPNYEKNISVRNVLEKIKISCFSEFNNSILLWSHYADSHKGICIGYKIDQNYLKENNIHLEKVIYINSSNNDIRNFKSFLSSTFFQKNEVWAYENEYRILGFDLSSNVIQSPEIVSITFGLKADESDISAVQKIFSNNDIKFSKVKPKENDYINLDIE